MTTTVAAPVQAEPDPRDPEVRLGHLLDAGSVVPLAPRDDSGAYAVRGRINGCPGHRVRHRRPEDGRRDGVGGLQAASWTRSSWRSPRACRSSGSGTPAAPGWPRASRRCDAVGLVFNAMIHASGQGAADLGGARPGRRRRRLRPGPHRRGDHVHRRARVRHRPRGRALGHRRERRHGVPRRRRHARPPQRRRAHHHRHRAGGPRVGPRRHDPAGRTGPLRPLGRSAPTTTWPRCCPRTRSGPTTCTRSSAGSSTASSSNCTRAGRRTSSPGSAGSPDAPSASSPTTRCAWAAASTHRAPRRRHGSCGCATRSASRWSCSSTCPATCPASGRSGTASCAAARSCCTRSPRRSSLGSLWSPASPSAGPTSA